MKTKITNLKTILTLLILLICSVVVTAQIPEATNPPRLVNDYAHIFNAQQVRQLEDSLVSFSKRTSNQITIVTVPTLNGMDKAQMAYEIGEKWGVGGKADNNGIVILIKPKNETNGEVFIAPGYGLEGVLPDATCRLIIEREMIPEFRNGDYYAGVVNALNVIMPIAAKEITKEEYEEADAGEWIAAIIAMAALIFIFYLIARSNKNNHGNNGGSGGGGRNGIDPIIMLAGMSALSRGSRGGFGGGGGFSGGGGFGGFGGGSFGGGGAGGSW